ncbi:dCTP deaminase [Lachnospiraceae bacterium 46-61]
MILTDNQIRQLSSPNEQKTAQLIYPFLEDSLQSESYDLSIDNKIAILKKEIGCIELDDQKMIDNMYEERTLLPSGYIISPKEYILVYLKEKITLPNNLTAHIRPRTKFTRMGLLISDQHCNSTYSGYLKIGLFNATDYAIRIVPNLKIAQIVFEELKSQPSSDKLYKSKKNASYQNEIEFRGVKFSNELINKGINILLG